MRTDALRTAAAALLLTAAVCAHADTAAELEQRAHAGDTEAMFALAQSLEADNLAEAAKWYEAAAQADHAPSLLHMGQFYLNGTVVAANRQAARAYFRKARDQHPAGSPEHRLAEQHLHDSLSQDTP
ncbi:MAG: hypothetical protein Q4E77_06640 [Conchiformibius sp.]|nr:hypothetical protein [Conchiformibius sp.]